MGLSVANLFLTDFFARIAVPSANFKILRNVSQEREEVEYESKISRPRFPTSSSVISFAFAFEFSGSFDLFGLFFPRSKNRLEKYILKYYRLWFLLHSPPVLTVRDQLPEPHPDWRSFGSLDSEL